MKTLACLFVVTSVCVAQIPDPNDPGNQTTNSTPTQYVSNPRPVRDGIIHTEDLEVIEWYNFHNRVFTVEHRLSLTDGSWQVIGEGYKDYVHNNPIGFYRVIRSDTDVVIPVWNSGTTNMVWTASSTSPYVTIECLNTNIPPEWGEGYIVVRTYFPAGEPETHCSTCIALGQLEEHNPALTRSELWNYAPRMTNGVEDLEYANELVEHVYVPIPAVIDVYAGDSGGVMDQHMQCTVVAQ